MRLTEVTNRLSLEVQDQVMVKDLALLAQRLEMVRRLDLELSGYVAELGTDGRLLALQLFELNAGLELLRALIEKDYEPIDPAAGFSLDELHGLSEAELLEPLTGPSLGVQPRHPPRHSDQRPRLSPGGADQAALTLNSALG